MCGVGVGVLITSRNRKDIFKNFLDISSLPIDQAIKLLQAWGGEQAADEAFAHQICELVGGLPLAVRLVGSYFTQTKEYANEYLEWLEETPLEALDQGERQKESIPILLDKSLAKVSLPARQCLAVVGILGSAPFDQQVIAKVLNIETRQARRLLGELVNYSLLARREDRRYEITHPLVHTYAEERLIQSDSNKTKITKRFIDYYFNLVQENKEKAEFLPLVQKEYPHILKVLKVINVKEEETAPESMIDFVEGLDKYWQVHSQYNTQEKWLQKAYDCTSILEQPLTQASFAQRIGRAFSGLGELEEALSWMAKGEKDLKDIEGREANSIRALIYIHRASALYLQNNLSEAKKNCIDGLNLADEHRQGALVAEGCNLLGSIYVNFGKYEKL